MGMNDISTKTRIPRLLRGDVLNWLRPECVQRPSLKSVSYRANLALEAMKTGRIELEEEFLWPIIERLSGKLTVEDTDQIVAVLKGADRIESPIWPYEDTATYRIVLPQVRKTIIRDIAYVPGGALAVLIADLAPGKGKGSEELPVHWRLAWIDLIAKEINHVYNLGITPRSSRPTHLVSGHEDDAPLAILQKSTLTYFDAAGFPFESTGPLFDDSNKGPRITAAALHPDTAELVAAVQRFDTTYLLRFENHGRASQLLRFPGQINRLFVSENLLVGQGLRDVATLNLSSNKSALRDFYPYFADQPTSTPGSALVTHDGGILIHEGQKVLRATQDLRLVEREFLLKSPASALFHWGSKIVQISTAQGSNILDITTSAPA